MEKVAQLSTLMLGSGHTDAIGESETTSPGCYLQCNVSVMKGDWIDLLSLKQTRDLIKMYSIRL